MFLEMEPTCILLYYYLKICSYDGHGGMYTCTSSIWDTKVGESQVCLCLSQTKKREEERDICSDLSQLKFP